MVAWVSFGKKVTIISGFGTGFGLKPKNIIFVIDQRWVQIG
jgi:hypothetical protein